MRIRKTLLVLLIIAALPYGTRLSFGHQDFERAIFTYSLHPDFPLEKFGRGELGVLQPSYARSYLYAAYRHLMGIGFNRDEQEALLVLWGERLRRQWDSDEEAWITDWVETRNKVPGAGLVPKTISLYRFGASWTNYFGHLNCLEDAFRTAAGILNERIETFGADSEEVKDWLQAQDHVFMNCSLDRGIQTIPAAAKPGAHPLIQADRAYQIAAAHFYAGHFDTAQTMFREIANDPSSPWSQIAPYLAARALIRKATLGPGYGEIDETILSQAEDQLKKVLSDSKLVRIHTAAQRLLNLVRLRLYPDERLHELAHAVLKKSSGDAFKQDVWDYTVLLDKFIGISDELAPYSNEAEKFAKFSQKFEELSAVRRQDDITDWILTFQVKGQRTLDHSLQKWAETSSLPWLVATLSKISSGHSALSKLLEAARNVKEDSPAFLSVAYHSIRLMMESGKKEEAHKRLDSLFSQAGLSSLPSSRNLFVAWRMKIARNLEELLNFAPRVPAGITAGDYDDNLRELPQDLESNERLKAFAGRRALFDADSAKVLNERMPLSLLKEAAKSKALPLHLRRELALATWVRSVLLDNEGIARELVPVLEGLVPELKQYLDAYLAAKSLEARQFAAAFVVLKFPGVRPYIYGGVGRLTPLNRIDSRRDNWWCSFRPDAQVGVFWNYYGERSIISEHLRTLYPDAEVDAPEFLGEAQKAAARREWEKLSSIGTAPNYLSLQVIEWAKRNPDDPRVPEALHLAVKSTRYGCADKETSKFSKQTFQLLHKRYPSSSWAAKTKYWY